LSNYPFIEADASVAMRVSSGDLSLTVRVGEEKRRMSGLRLVILVVFATALFSAAVAQEKKIKRSDLPPAVEKTVAAESNRATIRGFAQQVALTPSKYPFLLFQVS
jgi:hypothetical protein